MSVTSIRPRRSLLQRPVLALYKYGAVLRVSIANNLAYILEVFFRALMLIIIVFIMSQLWRATFAARGGKALSGFGINDMIWYLSAVETIAMSLPALTRRIDQEVRSGEIAYLLGRPCNYVLYNFAQYLGERLVRITINGIVAAGLALLFAGPPHFTWAGGAAWLLAAFLAISIEFAIYFSVGLLAFWTEETNAFFFIISRLTLVLGGVLAPLEIFPQPLRSIAQALPFSMILYGPARVLLHFETGAFLALLWQQSLTLLIVCLIMAGIYTLASRRISINGG